MLNGESLARESGLTGTLSPFGPSTITFTSPFPAEKVSIVKFAGASTTGPLGSIPGPYILTLHYNTIIVLIFVQYCYYFSRIFNY